VPATGEPSFWSYWPAGTIIASTHTATATITSTVKALGKRNLRGSSSAGGPPFVDAGGSPAGGCALGVVDLEVVGFRVELIVGSPFEPRIR
jgi:hypothetical protein